MSQIHCDYLKFSLPTVLSDTELDQLCLELFGYSFRNFDRLGKCRDRYKDCFNLGGLVNIYRNGYANNARTTCFDIPGSGIRGLELDLPKLYRLIRDRGGNVCRYDIAADDTDNVLPFDEMARLSMGEVFKEQVKTKLCRNRKDDQGEGVQVLPEISIQPRRIQYGSTQSDNYIVVYDREHVAGVNFPFMRVELRITNQKDTKALLVALTTEGVDRAQYCAGVLRGKLEFLNLDNAKKERRSAAPWWDGFLNSAQVCKLKREEGLKPKVESRHGRTITRAIEKIMEQGNSEAMQLAIAAITNPECQKLAYGSILKF